jgi:A/G-specific adenine glycosylase
MLQQTQVSRVLEKFGPFLEQFDSVQALADADETRVMAAWSGLGYYRRARLLHACSKAIVQGHGGTVPSSIEQLQELPGIGRYTAGAIASIVFGEREAIVDGNVCRVLQRLDAREGHAGDRNVTGWAWGRAERLVGLTARGKEIAHFNEGLMELGATVCTPDGPRCDRCPLSGDCIAYQNGLTESIPAPKPRAKRRRVQHDVVIVHRRGAKGTTEYLLEQRPETGLWAGMWQPPASEAETSGSRRTLGEVLVQIGLAGIANVDCEGPRESVFQTTHREVLFRAWRVRVDAGMKRTGRKWVAEHALSSVGISNAHRQLMLRV